MYTKHHLHWFLTDIFFSLQPTGCVTISKTTHLRETFKGG